MTFFTGDIASILSSIWQKTNVREYISSASNIVNSFREKKINESTGEIDLHLIDPKIKENILTILNLSNEEAKDTAKINKNYYFLLASLEEKKKNLSPILGLSIQQIIDNVTAAYQELNKINNEDNMKRISQNVFSTPLEIYEEAKKIFPKMKADIETNDVGFKMNLTLSDYLPVMSLEKAVDANAFLEQMKQLNNKAKLSKFICEEGCPETDIDIKRFSVVESLCDWQKYRRVMFEKEGKTCEDEIVKYLKNQDNIDILSHLGLSPDQVEIEMTESDLAYFRNVLDQIKKMSSEDKRLILSKFKEKYLNIYKNILDEQVREKQQKDLENKSNFFQDTFDKLRTRVLGQDQATEELASLLTTQKGNYNNNKVFIFAGPTGVGKTELAKAVSEIKKDRFVNFSMNQYQNEADIARFFGSPTGYIGSTDKPPLARELDKFTPSKSCSEGFKFNCEVNDVVILFDEFEKAHEKVKQSLLTIFDEGYWSIEYTKEAHTISQNIKVEYKFKRCIFINTSNLYQDEILKAFLAKKKINDIAQMFVELNTIKPLRTSLSKELLGRTSVIPFGPIPRGECYQKLVKIKMTHFFNDLKEKISCREIEVKNERLILLSIENKLYGNGTDIRRVNRYFENIREAISRTKSEWGNMQMKKLTFSHDGEKFYIKIYVYLEGLEIYHDLKVPLLILP